MASLVHAGDIVVAVGGAVIIGMAVGLATGFGARSLGWPTGFVEPVTGAVITGLGAIFYRKRVKRRASLLQAGRDATRVPGIQ